MTVKQHGLSASELETAFESMGEAAIIIDKHGHVIRANYIALKLLGYKEAELIGKKMLSKVTALNADHIPISPINRPAVRAVITGKPYYEYLYHYGKNKNLIPVFVSASPIIKDGRPIGVMEIFRDISMEEAVDQMKSEFISLASHQLRTPLSAIKTYSHMLLDGYMGEIEQQQRPALEIIVAATNRMNELISTLLNITRLESGAIVVDKNLVDLTQLSKEVVDEMEILTKAKDIRLSLNIKGDNSTKITSDGPLIKEVLSNLVSNAIKYSKEKGTVKITLRGDEHDATFVVKDNGIGIPNPEKANIFSKFFRAHNVIQFDTNGTGLGLYLVKGLVDELGGEISFTSTEGKGTSFKFTLPRKITHKK